MAQTVSTGPQDGAAGFSLAVTRSAIRLSLSEGSPSDEALAECSTWGNKFGFVPAVDRSAGLEPLHQVNISHRWNRDKTDDLQ